MTRTAISPRLAINILRNKHVPEGGRAQPKGLRREGKPLYADGNGEYPCNPSPSGAGGIPHPYRERAVGRPWGRPDRALRGWGVRVSRGGGGIHGGGGGVGFRPARSLAPEALGAEFRLWPDRAVHRIGV